MKNWMLICCFARDITTPQFFETKDEAVEAMCEEVADYIGFTTDEIMSIRLDDGKVDEYTHVDDDYAWSDKDYDCNWRIFNIEGRR